MMFFGIFLIPLFFYWFSRPSYPAANGVSARDAIDILRERYAREEIEFQEFEERQRELGRTL